jgi:biotin-[acetyl-CoA-carboxylase] ligase BirA-like protein
MSFQKDSFNYSCGVNSLGNVVSCFDLPVHWMDDTPSTNDEAKKFIAQHAINKVVLFATAFQSQGRGQHGKQWVAPRGTCILTSLAIPPLWVAWNPMLLKWAAALAVSETCFNFGLRNITIKKPNDVLVDGKKISGILLETVYQQGHLSASILGIGINGSFNVLPDSEAFPVLPTSFTLENVRVSLSELYGVLVKKMDPLFLKIQTRDMSLVDHILPWIREQDREAFHREIIPFAG